MNICRCVIMDKCRLVNMDKCRLVIMDKFHCVIMVKFCRVITNKCCCVIMDTCHCVIMDNCRCVIMNKCRSVIMEPLHSSQCYTLHCHVVQAPMGHQCWGHNSRGPARHWYCEPRKSAMQIIKGEDVGPYSTLTTMTKKEFAYRLIGLLRCQWHRIHRAYGIIDTACIWFSLFKVVHTFFLHAVSITPHAPCMRC
jgi:hypothetical protein